MNHASHITHHLQHGREYNDTTARKLSQSFGLEIVGGKAITIKQVCSLTTSSTGRAGSGIAYIGVTSYLNDIIHPKYHRLMLDFLIIINLQK